MKSITLWIGLIISVWASEPSITLELPYGGWRYTHDEANGFLQRVYYPASSVSSEDQPRSALIRGEIRSHAKKTPAILIVNGVALPLFVGEDGHFERPYAFGRGSNSIEIREGNVSEQVQFYENNPTKNASRLRIVLSWDSDGTDLDLHVISPDGEHVYYGNRIANNGGAQDIDVTTGYGPEIYANPTPPEGTYYVYVNYYGSGENDTLLTTAQVSIISQEGTLNEKQQVFIVPMRKAGELTLVNAFSYP